jgi:glycosyltransferase involved in cell wall biosynthesis
MPMFNALESVKRSIASFQELSKLLDDVDLWIIDDCSTDGSFQLVQDIANGDKNIKLLRNEKNIGPGLSRNIALEKISLGYIGFIDSDDEFISDNYYKSFVNGMKKSAEVITCNALVFKNGIDNPRYDFQRLTSDRHEIVRKCLRGEFDGSVIFSIYSADFVHKHYLRFPNGYYEDIPFSYSALMFSSKIYISNIYSYRKINRDNSIINTITRVHLKGMLRSSIAVKNIAIKNHFSKYDEFMEDFSYGMHGYIASIIISILINGGSDANKENLLQYLKNLISMDEDINNIIKRANTNKDILARKFLEIENEVTLSDVTDLSILYKKLF